MQDTAPPARCLEEVRVTDETSPTGVPDSAELVEDDLLVEEVSIDGMCGVY